MYKRQIYATADQSPYTQGLQIINMDNYTVTNISTHFERAHNIFVDTAHARLYVAGSNTVSRGLIVYDISNPLTPVHLSNIQINLLVNAPNLNTYVHDVYVRNNIAYTSNGSIKKMYQLDVSNLNNVQVMATYNGAEGYNLSLIHIFAILCTFQVLKRKIKEIISFKPCLLKKCLKVYCFLILL